MSPSARPPVDVAALVQLACLLEASAPKPGNVSPGRAFHDTSYDDFLISAAAIGPAFADVARNSIGTTIEQAIEATARATRANTNLGIVLLLAPLAKAAGLPGGTLRERVGRVLAETTTEDARLVYQAIRRAGPGGMGKAGSQDLSETPTVTLTEAMALARDRDAVAREYATDFELTFTRGAPALRAARAAGLGWSDAVVETFLTLLASSPDTLIVRKGGRQVAESVSRRASEIAKAGGVRTEEGRALLRAFDAELRDPQNTRNPGTTADLTAAAIFVALLEDGWLRS
jgi:triphosphoribosyl-dephospho-CoA synthase